MKTTIIYWSGTGNTKKMSHFIMQGLIESEPSLKTIMKSVSECSVNDINGSEIVVLGCSAMGVEEIDASEMEPFIRANEQAFKGKSIALFGSYGWGDGEWMETWEVMMEKLGAKIELESLIVNELPEGESEKACIEFGKKISQLSTNPF